MLIIAKELRILTSISIYIYYLLLFIPSALSLESSRFTQYTTQNGLSHNNVTDIHQDKDGFMWFGTRSGLSRFDGYQFTNYYHNNNNPFSLSDNLISAITSDSNGYLWVATTFGGINRINLRTQKIKRFIHQDDNKNSISSNDVITLLHKDNKLWIGTAKGIDIFDLQTETFIHTNLYHQSEKLANKEILNIISIGDKFWLSTTNHVYIYDGIDPKVERINSDILTNTNSKSINFFIHTLYLDHKHKLWLGTSHGLIQIDPDTLSVNEFQMPWYNPKVKDVFSITEDSTGRLWAATRSSGIYQIDIYRNKIKRYAHHKISKDTLSSNNVQKIFVDKSQILWASAYTGGLNKLSLDSEQFGLHRPMTNHNKLADKPINAFYEDAKGFIWILQQSVLRFNLKTGIYDNPLTQALNYKPEAFVHINSIAGNKNYLWLSTETSGLIQYNISQNSLTYIQSKDAHQHGLKNDHIHNIYYENNILWLDSKEGLYKHEMSDSYFSPLFFAPEDYKNHVNGNINNVHTDHQGYTWIASFHGVFQLKQGNLIKYFTYNPDGKSEIASNIVNDLASNGSDTLWIATDNGLNKYNYKTQSFSVLTTEEGLPDNTIKSVILDKNNMLWLSTNKGIAYLNPENNNIVNFHESDGLQSETFHSGARLLTKDHKLIFGGTHGFNLFDPDLIKKRKPTNVKISELYIFDKRVTVADLQKPGYPTNINNPAITLDYHENDLSITLSTLDYHDPLAITYRFKLNGFHEQWITRDAKSRVASFTNLNPGTYHFKAQASTDNNNWTKEKNLLTITVLPPWWLTPYAYFIYVNLTIALLYILVRLQTYHLKRKSQILEKIVNERTQQIQQQKSLIEEQASHLQILIKKKDQVFSHISHEFRTPLTLILGPLKNLFNVVSEAQQKSIELVQTNAYRLLRLVDQLLELSKLHAQQDIPEIKEKGAACETNALIAAILPSFQVLAENKSITLQLTDHDHCKIACSYDSLEKIITNLLSNAIKYTLEKGEITLSITNKNETQCEISVKDNGLGIPVDQQNNIFEPFTRVENHGQQQSIPGTGIGLSLVKELVETHGGTIQLKSQLGEGSCFTVILLLTDVEKQIIYQKNQHIDEMNLDIIDLSNRIQQELSPRKENLTVDSDMVIDEKQPVLLIIEDNPEMRQYIQDLCSPYYQCLLASNGKQGVQLAIDYIPDIILSDIMMPELDGHGCLKRLKADRHTCHIPVILLSALKDRENRLQGLQEKADDILTKPFDSEELLIRLKNLMAIRDLLKRSSMDGKDNEKTITNNEEDTHKNISELDQMFLQHFELMLDKYYTDETLNLEIMAQHLLLSGRQMQRKLKALTGNNPNEYLRDFRLNRAAEKFRKGYGVENAAYQVGFASRSYFSKCFKIKYKMTAKEYQQQFSTQKDLL